jgi:tRNA A-37 threonylcarbamoyl transferase component Bud32
MAEKYKGLSPKYRLLLKEQEAKQRNLQQQEGGAIFTRRKPRKAGNLSPTVPKKSAPNSRSPPSSSKPSEGSYSRLFSDLRITNHQYRELVNKYISTLEKRRESIKSRHGSTDRENKPIFSIPNSPTTTQAKPTHKRLRSEVPTTENWSHLDIQFGSPLPIQFAPEEIVIEQQPVSCKHVSPAQSCRAQKTRYSSAELASTDQRENFLENSTEKTVKRGHKKNSSAHDAAELLKGMFRTPSTHSFNSSLGTTFENDNEEKEKLMKTISSCFLRKGMPPSTTTDFYKFGKQIGKGAFGKVHQAIHRLTGLKVAVKTIEKSYFKDERSRRKVFQEVFTMKRVNHPNVVRLLEVFESSKHLMIVLEYAGGGDLLQFVKSRGKLSEPEAKLIFKQVIDAVKACHVRNIIHRDVKLDNILLNADFNCIKLCDFGVSKIVKPGQKISEQCGTPAYLAPEIIADRGYEPFYVDIWSMGVLLYAILTGTVPFKAKSLNDLHKLILRGKYYMPDHVTIEARSLITGMLNIIPQNRLTLDEMLRHEWFLTTFHADLELRDASLQMFCKGFYSSYASDSVDEALLGKVEMMGFPREFMRQSLRYGEINHGTATYILLSINKTV